MKNSDALLMQLRARDGFISFATAKAKPGTKNCVKGWSCGNTCLSRTKKNCKKALEGQAKNLTEWLERQDEKLKTKTNKTKKAEAKADVITSGSQPQAQRLEVDHKFNETDFDQWRNSTANELEKVRKKTDNDELLTGKEARIEDNSMIVETIMEQGASNPESFRGIRDAKGNLQAAAVIKPSKDRLHVDYLATASWNLIDNDERITKGAGTEMMRQIVEESVKAGYGGKLELWALPGAQSFYEKIGFVVSDDVPGLSFMELSPEAAQTFLKRISKK